MPSGFQGNRSRANAFKVVVHPDDIGLKPNAGTEAGTLLLRQVDYKVFVALDERSGDFETD